MASVALLPWVLATSLSPWPEHSIEERVALPQIGTGHTVQETQQLLDGFKSHEACILCLPSIPQPGCRQDLSQVLSNLWEPPSMARPCYQQIRGWRSKQMSICVSMNDGRGSWRTYTTGSIILHEYTHFIALVAPPSRKEPMMTEIYIWSLGGP